MTNILGLVVGELIPFFNELIQDVRPLFNFYRRMIGLIGLIGCSIYALDISDDSAERKNIKVMTQIDTSVKICLQSVLTMIFNVVFIDVCFIDVFYAVGHDK